MARAEISFPNIIAACYFEGHLGAGNGSELGLRKHAIGRQLDLVRCIVSGATARSSPELALRLAAEVLTAPWYFEDRRRIGEVAKGGFYSYVADRRRSGYYRPIYMAARTFAPRLVAFARENEAVIRSVYGEVMVYDLILSELQTMAGQAQLGGVIPIPGLVDTLVDHFGLQPTPAVRSVFHAPTGQTVVNTVSSDGYEKDLAKRLIEIATLKRHLIPVLGVPVMAILVKNRAPQGDWVFKRIPCQGLRLNREPRTFEFPDFDRGGKEEESESDGDRNDV
jgi:hypothetical protein